MATKRKKNPPKSAKHEFFNFQRRKFSVLARDYHHELHHSITTLMDINIRIRKSEALCEASINLLQQEWTDSGLDTSLDELLYHLENYYFRAAAFRDKLAQFVNQALQLGYDEYQRELIKTMSNNRIYKDSNIHTELKKFDKDKVLKEIVSKRVPISHRRYYSQEKLYNPFFIPQDVDPKKLTLYQRRHLWIANIKKEVTKVDKFTTITMKMLDDVMLKVNTYLDKNTKTRKKRQKQTISKIETNGQGIRKRKKGDRKVKSKRA